MPAGAVVDQIRRRRCQFLLGGCWFVGHLPLWVVDGATTGFPLALLGGSVVATAFVYTWLVNNTGGSVLALTVFHGLRNVSNGLVALHPGVNGERLSAYVIVGMNVPFARSSSSSTERRRSLDDPSPGSVLSRRLTASK
jgi:hypothetical protein